MTHFPSFVRCCLLAVGLVGSFSAWAIPDHITVPATNPWTGQVVTFSLDRYSLRSTNYQVRLYSTPTSYTLLPTNLIPEVTTFRGRILEDAGAHVLAGIRPNGNMRINVSYGCRDTGGGNYKGVDSYDGTNRFGWTTDLMTTNVPSVGYVYALAPNMPVPVAGPAVGSWYNDLGATNCFGGPPAFNNTVKLPTLRAKVVCDVTPDVFSGNYGGNVNYAILGIESCIDVVDFLHTRDAGSCYQIVAIGIQTNAANPGANYNDAPANQRNAKTQNYGGGVAALGGNWSITDPEDMDGVVHTHEMGHNLGMLDVIQSFDYQGRGEPSSHSGSARGHGVLECAEALYYEAHTWHSSEEWVLYNSPMPPHAMPDYASTLAGMPVSVDVLLNDRDPNATNRASLGISSYQAISENGGSVTNLGDGWLSYAPAAGFRGDDLFRYYVTNASGMKSLMGVRVLVVDTNNPLIAQYKLDETNGNKVVDSLGTGKYGLFDSFPVAVSLTNISVPGVGGGRALHFDGTFGVDFRDVYTPGPPGYWVPSSASYSYDAMDQSQTISFWFKPDVTPGATPVILLGKREFPGSYGMWIGITGNTIFASPNSYGGASALSVYAPIVPMPGAWYHLAVEVDRGSGLLRMWVNGVEYASTSGTRTIPASEWIIGDHAIYLGSGAIIPGGYASFRGAMQDFRVYTKALSQAEITTIYNDGGMLAAGGPVPVNGEPAVNPTSSLTWVPGRTNYQHDVYVGSSSNAVANATTNSPEYMGRVSTNRYTPGAPWIANSTYYWRVDEVDGTNYATGPVWLFTAAFQPGVAQPFFKVLTSEQLAAQTPVLLDVVATSYYDPLTIIGCDAASARGGSVTITNNQLRYTPPGVFSGTDTFTYTATDVLGTNSSALVTIYAVTQPHYVWDANGAEGGTGGTGTWDTSSFLWDDGTHVWPASGTNFALFQGTGGIVSVAGGGVSANGLYFGADGYVIEPQVDNVILTLNGVAPVVIVDPGMSATINSTVTNSSGLSKLGTGVLTLGGANTYKGGTTISAGALVLNHASALGAATNTLTLGDANTSGNAVALKVDTAVAGAITLAALNTTTNASATTITLNAGSALGANQSELTIGTLNLNGSAPLTIAAMNTGGHSTAQDINYRLAGSGVASGTTALTLDGTAASLRTSFPNAGPANNFTGDVVIKGTVSTQGRTYLNQNATNQNLGFLNNNVTVSSNSTWTVVWGGETIGALNGAGNISLNNQNALNSIGLTVGNNGANGIHSGIIAGGFGVRKSGAGTQTFSGVNTYSGTTTISQGTLSLNNATAIPATANVVLGDSASGATSPTLGLSYPTTLNSLTVGAGVSSATLYVTPNGTVFATFNTVTLNSPLTISKANVGGNWQGIQTSGGKITGPGGGAGNDSLILMNAGGAQAYWQGNNITNDFLGNVRIATGNWRLQDTGGSNLVIPDTASVTVESGASLNFSTGGLPEAIDGLNGGGGVSPSVGLNSTFTLGAGGGNGNFSGVLANGSGTLAIAKVGGGTQTLSGTNTYTGTTTVSNGTLLVNVNGSLAAGSAVTVGVGALGGTGTIRGATTVGAGGALVPGANGIGTLSISNALSLQGIAIFEISKTGGVRTNDLVRGMTSVTYGGTLAVTNITSDGNTLTAGDTFTLFRATGFSGGFAATNLPPLTPGLGWVWTPAAGTLSVVATVAMNPTNLTCSVSGGTLMLTWPADHQGWSLQCQTNSLAVGLRTNWITIPGSQNMSSTNIPIDAAKPTVFYRLISP